MYLLYSLGNIQKVLLIMANILVMLIKRFLRTLLDLKFIALSLLFFNINMFNLL